MENKVFTDVLRNLGWNIEASTFGKEAELDLLANGRLGKVNQEVREFITSFNVCANGEDSIWFCHGRITVWKQIPHFPGMNLRTKVWRAWMMIRVMR